MRRHERVLSVRYAHKIAFEKMLLVNTRDLNRRPLPSIELRRTGCKYCTLLSLVSLFACCNTSRGVNDLSLKH